MKHYRIKYGYRADEFVSVDETELPMAVRAHISGKKGLFKEGSVSGDKIIAIVPDYQRDMGWNRDYILMGEDYDELGKEKLREYTTFLEETKNMALGGQETKQLN